MGKEGETGKIGEKRGYKSIICRGEQIQARFHMNVILDFWDQKGWKMAYFSKFPSARAIVGLYSLVQAVLCKLLSFLSLNALRITFFQKISLQRAIEKEDVGNSGCLWGCIEKNRGK